MNINNPGRSLSQVLRMGSSWWKHLTSFRLFSVRDVTWKLVDVTVVLIRLNFPVTLHAKEVCWRRDEMFQWRASCPAVVGQQTWDQRVMGLSHRHAHMSWWRRVKHQTSHLLPRRLNSCPLLHVGVSHMWRSNAEHNGSCSDDRLHLRTHPSLNNLQNHWTVSLYLCLRLLAQ